MELTISDLESYASMVELDDVNTIDDVVRRTGWSIDHCHRLHDLIAKIANKITRTSTYSSRRSLEDQLRLIDDLISHQSTDLSELSNQDKSSMLSSVTLASKLRGELATLQAFKDSNDAISNVLETLFKALSTVDPVLAIKVRDTCVKEMDQMVVALPAVPGANYE